MILPESLPIRNGIRRFHDVFGRGAGYCGIGDKLAEPGLRPHMQARCDNMGSHLQPPTINRIGNNPRMGTMVSTPMCKFCFIPLDLDIGTSGVGWNPETGISGAWTSRYSHPEGEGWTHLWSCLNRFSRSLLATTRSPSRRDREMHRHHIQPKMHAARFVVVRTGYTSIHRKPKFKSELGSVGSSVAASILDDRNDRQTQLVLSCCVMTDPPLGSRDERLES